MISPREEKKVFPLPTSHQEDISNHSIYQITQPCEVKTQSGVFLSKFYLPKTNKSQLIPGQLGCSEQLQTVVERARKMKQISNNNDNKGYTWQPDRSKLKLHFENPLYENPRETVVDRARKMKQISNNNDNIGYTWQPDRSKLKLHFENPLYENPRETFV